MPRRISSLYAGLALCLLPLLGCQQQTVKNAPGALPNTPIGDEKTPLTATTYFAHGHLLERQGDLEHAIVQYQRALKIQPEFLSARNRLGITLNKLARHSEATAEFRQALVGHENESYLQNNLGFSLYLEGKYPEALTVLKRAVELKPDFVRARTNLALVHAKLGQFDEAYAALKQDGNDADAAFNMGMILTEAKHYREAAKYLELALSGRPNFEDARQQLRIVARLAAQQDTNGAGSIPVEAGLVSDSPRTNAKLTQAGLTEPAPMATTGPLNSTTNSTPAQISTTDTPTPSPTTPPAPTEPSTSGTTTPVSEPVTTATTPTPSSTPPTLEPEPTPATPIESPASNSPVIEEPMPIEPITGGPETPQAEPCPDQPN